MSARRFVGLVVAVAALACASAAAAKDFEPGDLRLCNAKRCVPVMDKTALQALSAF